MAKSTDKLAPRIIVEEHDIQKKYPKKINAPVTLVFGFSPIGKTCEMVQCNTSKDVYKEFGFPSSAPEKFFIDSALKVIENGATALMTRLPYDNAQSHNVKFVEYTVGKAVKISDLATGPSEMEVRKNDDIGVTILKEMNHIDPLMNQYQRITQVSDSMGISIRTMSNEELVEMELDPIANIPQNSFRIVDIRGQQYGRGCSEKEYAGIFPIITTSAMAMYYQGKIQNRTSLDDCFALMNLRQGIEASADWYIQGDPIDDEYKIEQSKIVASIKQSINFDSSKNKFHRMESFQDSCVRRFPVINMAERTKLDNSHLKDIGLLVCQLKWDSDQQESKLEILESFVGKLGRSHNCIDKKINESSQYIRMYKNLSVPAQTDYFVCDHQKLTSIGMTGNQCDKYINYKTSIIDPVTFMLENDYSDIDSLQIDVILDAGLSATAFSSYVAKNIDGESFKTNPTITTKIDWSASEYDISELEDYAYVWNQITSLFGNFCKNVRGDCVYIADGPRILNLTRNYPIRNYTDMENIEMFNRYLPYFNGNTTNYVARYFNWVYIEDMQQDGYGLWVPGSVVMGGQLASNDRGWGCWFAPAGQERGLVNTAYDVSVRTKQYNQENDILYQNHWNFFQIYQNTGVVVEGQKTLQTKKTALDRLNVRRLVCHIKQQTRVIANRYKYEPHTKAMRASFKSELDAFLFNIQRGSGISEFHILCDESNNSTETMDRHELYCKIGIKPIKAIEYIIIDLNIINGEVSMGDNQIVVDKSM